MGMAACAGHAAAALGGRGAAAAELGVQRPAPPVDARACPARARWQLRSLMRLLVPTPAAVMGCHPSKLALLPFEHTIGACSITRSIHPDRSGLGWADMAAMSWAKHAQRISAGLLFCRKACDYRAMSHDAYLLCVHLCVKHARVSFRQFLSDWAIRKACCVLLLGVSAWCACLLCLMWRCMKLWRVHATRYLLLMCTPDQSPAAF